MSPAFPVPGPNLLLLFLSPTSTKPEALNIVLSKVCLQRRLIGVKCVEEGDRISPLVRVWVVFFSYCH